VEEIKFFIHFVSHLPFTLAMFWSHFPGVCLVHLNSNIHPWMYRSFALDCNVWLGMGIFRFAARIVLQAKRWASCLFLSFDNNISWAKTGCFVLDKN